MGLFVLAVVEKNLKLAAEIIRTSNSVTAVIMTAVTEFDVLL